MCLFMTTVIRQELKCRKNKQKKNIQKLLNSERNNEHKKFCLNSTDQLSDYEYFTKNGPKV